MFINSSIQYRMMSVPSFVNVTAKIYNYSFIDKNRAKNC